jgi:hypothetical protein
MNTTERMAQSTQARHVLDYLHVAFPAAALAWHYDSGGEALAFDITDGQQHFVLKVSGDFLATYASAELTTRLRETGVDILLRRTETHCTLLTAHGCLPLPRAVGAARSLAQPT